ncbi:hypothetical protein [Paraburkholderia flagellata]|uniref:hypothetical protein n=1 Tax=Paraburkholderia flagellata TaxID=2883241 RepID=UPI001F4531D3|nr:hypothetical protein [Paraburkholderia flagellata]
MSVLKPSSCGHYPYVPPNRCEPVWRENGQTTLRDISNGFSTSLPFGNGGSHGYERVAATDHVLVLRAPYRLNTADWKAGVVRAKAGDLRAEGMFVIRSLRGIALKGTTL